MQSNSNINTGLASQIDSFRFNTDNKPHVIGVKTSAPDFSIPPTPASSYQNIYALLRPESLSAATMQRSADLSMGSSNRSFSSLPSSSNMKLDKSYQDRNLSESGNFSSNQLDEVPERSNRLVAEKRNPDEPMARSDISLTSLKSEIAPIAPLGTATEYDELAERNDRALPAAVDLALYDESEGYRASSSRSKEWALMEEDERSWRMSRSVDNAWLSNWKNVGREIRSFQFDSEDLTSWAEQVGREAQYGVNQVLRNSQLAGLEESERQWRMSRPIDATWAAQWMEVGNEVRSFEFEGSDLTLWGQQIGAKAEGWVNEALQKSNLNDLEESERQWRLNRTLDSNYWSAWKQVGSEIRSYYVDFDDLSQWAQQLSYDIERQVNDILSRTLALQPELYKLRDSLEQRSSIDFAALEEKERQYQMTRRVDPVFFGNWEKVGSELKSSRSSMFVGLRASLSELANKARNTVGSFVDSAKGVANDAIHSAEETFAAPAGPSEFADHKHLNLFAYSAENIDFTFKSRRTPSNLLAQIEHSRLERADQYNANRAGYKRWNKFLLDNAPHSDMERTRDSMKKAGKRVSGFFSSLGSSIAEKLHIGQKEEAPRDKVDPMTAARLGKLNDELIHHTVKSN